MPDGQGPALLTKDQVLGADDRATAIVEVPEWGGSVKIRALSAWEQSQYEQSLMDVSIGRDGKPVTRMKMEGANVRLAALAIQNGDGKPMFSEAELRGKSAGAIARIAEAVRGLSGMNVTVEEAEGN